MKYIFFLLAITLNAQIQSLYVGTQSLSYTIWYVDANATGTENGRSWTNAWTDLNDVVWASVSAGDYIYISGGTDSVTYPKAEWENKRYEGNVYITKGVDAGHTGKVIIQQQGVAADVKASLAIRNSRYLHFSNITFNSTADDGSYAQYIVRADSASRITFNNCEIISYGNGFGVGLDWASNITITNSTIEILANTYTYGQDPIISYQARGGFTFTDNIIKSQQRHTATGNHGDLIQLQQLDDDSASVTTIANNLFMYISTNDAIENNANIYIENSRTQHYDIYGNIFIWNGGTAGFTGINSYKEAGYTVGVAMYNNTLVNGSGGSSAPLVIGNLDTLIMKNNIVMFDSTSSGANVSFIQSAPASITEKDIDYNQYYHRGASVGFTGIGNFTSWQSAGYDANGYSAEPSFKNLSYSTTLLSLDDYRLNTTSTGYQDGTDLSSIFTTDIEGTTITNWNIGAVDLGYTP